MNITKTLDAKGLSCPMPIVRTKKEMDTLSSGGVLEVVVTDKGALNDIPAWVEMSGNLLLDQKTEDEVFIFYIQKG